jgi:hypothetical protein
MSFKYSNILITIIFPLYLNISAITTIRNNSDSFVQENPIISSDELMNNDKISDCYYYDADVLESVISGYSDTFIYDEFPMVISESHESVLLLIDLPPPVLNG